MRLIRPYKGLYQGVYIGAWQGFIRCLSRALYRVLSGLMMFYKELFCFFKVLVLLREPNRSLRAALRFGSGCLCDCMPGHEVKECGSLLLS